MRLVTLYTASKKYVTAYGDILPIYVHEQLVRSFNTSDIFVKSEVDVHHAKIHRFSRSDKYHTDETFVAFDPVLQDIVDRLVFKASDESAAKAKAIGDRQIKILQDQIKALQSRTILSMIADKFKRSKR